MPVDGPQYPVNLSLQGRRCLVVGAGRVARRKIEGLLSCDAVVHVVAERVSPAVRGLDVTIDERAFRDDDVLGVRLVIAATDDPAVNRRVFDAGERHGVWVNAADEPASCSFTLPAVVRRGPLMVAVSTGGHSPALATWLKRHVEGEMGPGFETLLELLSERRERMKASGRSTESIDWGAALTPELFALVHAGDLEGVAERLDRVLGDS